MMEREIKQYFELLEQLTKAEHKQHEAGDIQLKQQAKGRWLWYLQIMSVTCLIICVVTTILTTMSNKFNWLQPIGELFFALFFLGFCISITVLSFSKSSALSLMKENGEIDSYYLWRLSELSNRTLELGALELTHGRDWFARGLNIFLGIFEKVGLFPAIFSVLTIFSLSHDIPRWLMGLILIYILIYCLAVVIHERLLRIDRMLALTQLALKLKLES